MVVRAVLGLALSCCKGTLFRLTNAGYLCLKIHELVPVVEHKVPHRLHARLKQTLSESHLRNLPDIQHYLGTESISLTMTLAG